MISRRFLHGNQLTGPIPSTIGELKALDTLYVQCTLHRRLFVQRFLQVRVGQPIDGNDPGDDWATDGPSYLVSWMHASSSIVCSTILQVLVGQPIDGNDPGDDWATDGPSNLVSWMHASSSIVCSTILQVLVGQPIDGNDPDDDWATDGP
jgi:hypothetical protein